MRQAIYHLTVPTNGQGFIDITAELARFVEEAGIASGLATIFCRHTSASLLIQENADPDVRTDLTSFFARIAPEGSGLYVHDTEGPDDMPAHIRTALTQSSIGIPVERGKLVLGTWQGIYLFEHRSAPHRREIVLQVMGE
jgi:secondary thiamine-phosphate synthase enzyme